MNVVKQERLYQILRRPHVTEKAMKIADENNQIVFRVLQNANKQEIKEAVEMIFKVNVIRVQTLSQKEKLKRRGAMLGRRAGWRKAIVTIQKGQEVNFSADTSSNT